MDNIEPLRLGTLQLGLFFVLALIAMKIIEQAINYFFAKIIKTEYMTVTKCEICRKECKNLDNEFRKEIREKLGIITGALVVLAAGKEITMDELQRLITTSQH